MYTVVSSFGWVLLTQDGPGQSGGVGSLHPD